MGKKKKMRSVTDTKCGADAIQNLIEKVINWNRYITAYTFSTKKLEKTRK